MKVHEKDEDEGVFANAREGLRELYFGTGKTSERFQRALFFVEILILCYFIVSSFLYWPYVNDIIDIALVVFLTLDYVARALIAIHPLHYVVRPGSLLDLSVIVSLIAPMITDNLTFLRVWRAVRLARSYHIIGIMRRKHKWVQRNEEVIQRSIDLFVFVFVVTAFVFVSQVEINDEIKNYVDALYFTVATLTTTGFGDIILVGTVGKLLSVIIMIFGISLFIRLVQSIFRPEKVRHTCDQCGLQRHDLDAVHCKHCGTVINIPHDG